MFKLSQEMKVVVVAVLLNLLLPLLLSGFSQQVESLEQPILSRMWQMFNFHVEAPYATSAVVALITLLSVMIVSKLF